LRNFAGMGNDWRAVEKVITIASRVIDVFNLDLERTGLHIRNIKRIGKGVRRNGGFDVCELREVVDRRTGDQNNRSHDDANDGSRGNAGCDASPGCRSRCGCPRFSGCRFDGVRRFFRRGIIRGERTRLELGFIGVGDRVIKVFLLFAHAAASVFNVVSMELRDSSAVVRAVSIVPTTSSVNISPGIFRILLN